MTNPQPTDASNMTEAEALDEAAKAAGWRDWKEAHERTWELDGMRAHAKTIMENAALKARAEIERDLRQQVKDDGCVVSGDGVSMVPTAMWIDAQVSLESIAALKAENERLFDALFDAIALIGHVVPMNTTALVGGEKLTALNVWQAGHDLMFPKRQARAALKEIEGD